MQTVKTKEDSGDLSDPPAARCLRYHLVKRSLQSIHVHSSGIPQKAVLDNLMPCMLNDARDF